MSRRKSSSRGLPPAFAFQFGNAGSKVEPSSSPSTALSPIAFGEQLSTVDVDRFGVTLALLRQYCDRLHAECLKIQADDSAPAAENESSASAKAGHNRAILESELEAAAPQRVVVSAAAVAYWTRKFLAESMRSMHEAGQQRAHANILQYLFLWRAVTIFHLPLSLSAKVPPQLTSSAAMAAARSHGMGATSSGTGGGTDGASFAAGYAEPPVTGVVCQLLDELLPSLIEERHNAVRHVVGGMSVANKTDSLELLRAARNTSLDIFCDKEAQVSRTSDPDFLGRRLVYLVRCRPQLRLQDWHAFDAIRHVDYEQYLTHAARRYCEVYHPWLFRLLFGGGVGENEDADNDEAAASLAPTTPQRFELLAPLIKITFDGSSAWDSKILRSIKRCIRHSKFSPGYDDMAAKFHEQVLLIVFGSGGSNLDDAVLAEHGLDYYLRRLFLTAYRDGSVAAITDEQKREAEDAADAEARAAAVRGGPRIPADRKGRFLFATLQQFQDEWASWCADVEDLQRRVRAQRRAGSAQHLNAFLDLMLPASNKGRRTREGSRRLAHCGLMHELVFAAPDRTRGYFQRHAAQAAQQGSSWHEFFDQCTQHNHLPGVAPYVRFRLLYHDDGPPQPGGTSSSIFRDRGSAVFGDRSDRERLLSDLLNDSPNNRTLSRLFGGSDESSSSRRGLSGDSASLRKRLLADLRNDRSDERHLFLRHMFAVADLDIDYVVAESDTGPGSVTTAVRSSQGSDYHIYLTRFVSLQLRFTATCYRLHVASLLLHWWHVLRLRQELFQHGPQNHESTVGGGSDALPHPSSSLMSPRARHAATAAAARAQQHADARAEAELVRQAALMVELFGRATHEGRLGSAPEEAATQHDVRALSDLFRRFLGDAGKGVADQSHLLLQQKDGGVPSSAAGHHLSSDRGASCWHRLQEAYADAMQGLVTQRALQAFKHLDGPSTVFWLMYPVEDFIHAAAAAPATAAASGRRETGSATTDLFSGRLRLAVALYIQLLCRVVFCLAHQSSGVGSSLLSFFDALHAAGPQLFRRLEELLAAGGSGASGTPVGRTAPVYFDVLRRLVVETRPGIADGGLFGHCALLVSPHYRAPRDGNSSSGPRLPPQMPHDFAAVMRSVLAMADIEMLPLSTIGDLVKVFVAAAEERQRAMPSTPQRFVFPDTAGADFETSRGSGGTDLCNWLEHTGVAGVFKLYEVVEWLELTDPALHARGDGDTMLLTPRGVPRKQPLGAEFEPPRGSGQLAPKLSAEGISKCRSVLSSLLLEMTMQ